MKNVQIMVILIFSVVLSSTVKAENDRIQMVIESVLGVQHDGTLELSGQFCTVASQKEKIADGKETLSFSYWFSRKNFPIVGITRSYDPKDLNWKIDSNNRTIIYAGNDKSESFELKFSDDNKIELIKLAEQNEWCILK